MNLFIKIKALYIKKKALYIKKKLFIKKHYN